MIRGPAQEKYEAICAGSRIRRLTRKFMRTPLGVLSLCETAACGLFKSSAREKRSPPLWRQVGHGKSFARAGPLVTAALAEILQCGESLQQPDADAGDGAGQETDTGNDHQYAHGALDRVEMPLHPREQRGELLDHER